MRARHALLIIWIVGCTFDWGSLEPKPAGQGGVGGGTVATSSGGGGDINLGGGGQLAGGQGGLGQGGAGGQGPGGGGGNGGGPADPWRGMQPVAELAGSSDDDDPTFTHDMLEVYFNSNRLTAGDADVWVAKRASVNDPWGTPAVEPVLSSPRLETNPVVSADGLRIWFSSRRDGQNNYDIYYSDRSSRSAPWSTPAPATAHLSDPMLDESVSCVLSGKLVMVHQRSGLLRRTERQNDSSPWGPLVVMPGLPMSQNQPWVSDDELTMYLDASDRIFNTTRTSTDDDWTTPVAVDELDVGPEAETDAWLSPDQRYMMFSYGDTLPMGASTRQIWEARR